MKAVFGAKEWNGTLNLELKAFSQQAAQAYQYS